MILCFLLLIHIKNECLSSNRSNSERSLYEPANQNEKQNLFNRYRKIIRSNGKTINNKFYFNNKHSVNKLNHELDEEVSDIKDQEEGISAWESWKNRYASRNNKPQSPTPSTHLTSNQQLPLQRRYYPSREDDAVIPIFRRYLKPTNTPKPAYEDIEIPAWERFKRPTATPIPEDEDDEEEIPAWERFKKPTASPIPDDEEKEEEISAWDRFKKITPTQTPNQNNKDNDDDSDDKEDDDFFDWRKKFYNKPTATPTATANNNKDREWERNDDNDDDDDDRESTTDDDDDNDSFWDKYKFKPKPTRTPIPKKPTKTALPDPSPSASQSSSESPSPSLPEQSPTPSASPSLPKQTPTRSPARTPKPSKSSKPEPTKESHGIEKERSDEAKNDQLNNSSPKSTKRPSGLSGAEVIVMISMLGAALVVLLLSGVFYFTGSHAVGKLDDESLMNNGYY